MKTNLAHLVSVIILSSAVFALAPRLPAQGTAFTYQGHLDSGGAPYHGNAEIQATLWDAANGGTALASNTPVQVVGVSNGLFVLPLDFGANFPGAERRWQLAVRTSVAPFTMLTPRQPLTPTPYAITASNLSGCCPRPVLPALTLRSGHAHQRRQQLQRRWGWLTGFNASQSTSGTVPDARLSSAVTRDAEVMPLVIANDGAGSGLDADLLDGLNSTAFVRTNGRLRKCNPKERLASGPIKFPKCTARHQVPGSWGHLDTGPFEVSPCHARDGGGEYSRPGRVNAELQTSSPPCFGAVPSRARRRFSPAIPLAGVGHIG